MFDLIIKGGIIYSGAGNPWFKGDVAIKKGRILAFECKAWKTVPRLKEKEYEDFLDWCDKAGAIGFLAWKNKEWLFLDIKKLKNTNIKKDGITLNDLMFVVNI